MPKVINVDEMLEILSEVEPHIASGFQCGLEAISRCIADQLCETLGVDQVGQASFAGTAFGGTCASFVPAHPGQACPEAFERFDPSGDWEEA